MQVDVGAAADVAGQGAADQPRAEGPQDAHHAEGFEPHVAEIFGPPLAFMEVGPDLDLIADFAVAGQIARLEIASGDPPGRLEFGRKIFRDLPVVHEPGGLPSHLAANLVAGHPLAPTQAARDARNGNWVRRIEKAGPKSRFTLEVAVAPWDRLTPHECCIVPKLVPNCQCGFRFFTLQGKVAILFASLRRNPRQCCDWGLSLFCELSFT